MMKRVENLHISNRRRNKKTARNSMKTMIKSTRTCMNTSMKMEIQWARNSFRFSSSNRSKNSDRIFLLIDWAKNNKMTNTKFLLLRRKPPLLLLLLPLRQLLLRLSQVQILRISQLIRMLITMKSLLMDMMTKTNRLKKMKWWMKATKMKMRRKKKSITINITNEFLLKNFRNTRKWLQGVKLTWKNMMMVKNLNLNHSKNKSNTTWTYRWKNSRHKVKVCLNRKSGKWSLSSLLLNSKS